MLELILLLAIVFIASTLVSAAFYPRSKKSHETRVT